MRPVKLRKIALRDVSIWLSIKSTSSKLKTSGKNYYEWIAIAYVLKFSRSTHAACAPALRVYPMCLFQMSVHITHTRIIPHRSHLNHAKIQHLRMCDCGSVCWLNGHMSTVMNTNTHTHPLYVHVAGELNIVLLQNTHTHRASTQIQKLKHRWTSDKDMAHACILHKHIRRTRNNNKYTEYTQHMHYI